MINLKTSVLELVDNAKKEINNIKASDALKLHDDKTNLFIDIRDIREIQKSGRILGAKHVPRCMLEFWIDPKSPYHKTFLMMIYDLFSIVHLIGDLHSPLKQPTI